MKFTVGSIKALKSNDSRYELYEDNSNGFGIRVSPAGLKSWISRYRDRSTGKLVKVTLGTFPDTSLTEARDKHNNIRQTLNKGKDPRAEAQASKRAHITAPTVEQLVEDYIEKWSKPRKRSWKIDKWLLEKDLVSRFGKMKAKDIKRAHLIAMLDEVVEERNVSIGANRLLAITRKMFNWAVGRGILDASPCVQIPAPAPENQRDRVLSDDEIKSFWSNLDNLAMLRQSQLALKLMLVTAQRKGEIVSAEKHEFDLKTNWWTIPADKAKNGLAHRVPLTPLAREIVKEAMKLSGDSRWLFSSPFKQDFHIDGASINQALRKNSKIFGIDGFVPHDVRRTAASKMTGMGIPRLTVKKILNHAESEVTAVYDRYSYDNEKRLALQKWDRKLKLIIECKDKNKEKSNVVSLNL